MIGIIKENKLIILYLVAIVLANLSSAYFGANASIINAFLFIGLDLTSRDGLHEKWKNSHLLPKMVFLITVGSVLSWTLNRNAGVIAVASLVAFLSAGLVDSLVYHLLRNKRRLVKINGSNVFSSIADSLIFPTIAFGGFSWVITIGQFLAKVVGGAMWSYILTRKNRGWDKK